MAVAPAAHAGGAVPTGMADPGADNADFAVEELKRKARRRLVGAIVLALAAATILPLLLEQEQKPLGDDISVQIPPVDGSKFVSGLKADKSGDAVSGTLRGAEPAPAAPATSTAPTAISAPVPVAPAAAGAAAGRAATAAGAQTKGMAPGAGAAADASGASKDSRATGGNAAVAGNGAAAVNSSAGADGRSAGAAAGSQAPASTNAVSAAASPAAAESTAANPAAPGSPPAGAAEAAKPEGYVVQLGAFTDKYGANALARKLKKIGYPAYTEPVETGRGTLWRVRVGGYPTRQAATDARARLKADGQDGLVTAAK
jgi:DedD protein